MNNPTIEIGALVYFSPKQTEANTLTKYIYQIHRNDIPGILSGEVIEKGLRWTAVHIDKEVKLVRIELLLVKDKLDGHLWSIQADRVLQPDFQTSK